MMKQEDIKEFDCKETNGCTGKQIRHVYAESDEGVISSQFRCNKCYKYVRIINGDFYCCGKYNLIKTV